MTAMWTIAPTEHLFASPDDVKSYREIEFDGIPILVEDVAENQCKIIRLLSTNPDDYLVNQLQPGNLLKYGVALPDANKKAADWICGQ